jgi:cephalosporin-C deacetylase
VPLLDLPLSELRTYRPDVVPPPDLVEFWTSTVAESRTHDLALSVEPYDNKLAVIDTYDVTYAGFGGTPVKAWLHVPAGAQGPLPTVVQYHGYSRGRGFPHDGTVWAQAGYAQLVMDTRGQGWAVGGPGGTPDWAPEAGLTHSPGFMTAGIDDPHTYYYRRVYTDALRLLDVAAALPVADADRMIVTGGSQGGGITIAVAGLAGMTGLPLRGVAPDVPFLCHFERAVGLTERHPYGEIAVFLSGWRDRAEAAYRTLSYVDGVNLGRHATAPALFSVALMDPICPPSTVFAAYHAYGEAGEATVPDKDIAVYGHNQHEGGGAYQVDRQLDWFAEVLR